MKEHIAISLMLPVCIAGAVLLGNPEEFASSVAVKTQPAIQTVIVTVRGCDVIQHIQGDKLIAAHNAADQPKSCKVAK